MPKFSVVIVNYNGGAYVQGALDSLAQQDERDFEVILVDNASADGSIDALDTSGLPAFTLMAETENHGFARGNNLAAKLATGTWLTLLNPDAEAAPDWLTRIGVAIERLPHVTMFASTQYNLHEPDELDGVGDAYLIFGFPWRGGVGWPSSALPSEGECFSPCGAGAVYRRETFLAHGGFDERLFCFCEDVDIGYRFRLAGERCVFLPDAVVHHAGGGLAGRASDFSIYHGTRNRLWIYIRNTPLPLLLLTLPGHAALTLYLLARAAMIGRASSTWRGLKDGVSGLRVFTGPSNWSVPKRKASLWTLARSMAWNPWKMSSRGPHVRRSSA